VVVSPNVVAERAALLLHIWAFTRSLPVLSRLEVWLFFFLRFSVVSLGPSKHIPASYLILGHNY